MEYRYETKIEPCGFTAHYWILVGPKGGVHIHIHERMIEEDYFGGVEIHNKTPIYAGQKPMPNCWVIGGDCYCDGSSLYARENLIPWFLSVPEDSYPELFRDELMSWYENKFGQEEQE